MLVSVSGSAVDRAKHKFFYTHLVYLFSWTDSFIVYCILCETSFYQCLFIGSTYRINDKVEQCIRKSFFFLACFLFIYSLLSLYSICIERSIRLTLTFFIHFIDFGYHENLFGYRCWIDKLIESSGWNRVNVLKIRSQKSILCEWKC